MSRLKRTRSASSRPPHARRPATARLPGRKRISRRIVGAGLGFCALIAAVVMDAPRRLYETMDVLWQKQSMRAGFVVKDIFVEGRHYVEREDILKAIAVRPGDSIFKCDPHKARRQLESIPWVQSALVQRYLPSTLYVRLAERQPIALWQNQSKMYLIGKDGTIIHQPLKPKDPNLIVVAGQDAPSHVGELLNVLTKFPSIRQEVTAAVWVSGRRWDVILKHRIRVKLPEGSLTEALQHLLEIQKKHPRFEQDINTIDIRLPDRSFLYIEPSPNYGITYKPGSDK